MTTAGIITMLLSIGAVWLLLIVCCTRLLRKSTPSNPPKKHRHGN